MADYPDDPDDLGDPDMVDDHDHPDLDEDATGGVSPDILLMGLIRAMAAKLQDEDDDEDEDNRRRRRHPSRRNQNDDDDDDVNRSVRLPPVVGKGKAASSSGASKMSYSRAARKQLPQLKQQPKQKGHSSSSNTSQHKTPVSNADYEGGGGVTSLPMAAQRSQRAEVVKGKRGVGGVGGGARPSTSSGSPVPAPAATSTTSTCCDLLTREVLTTTEQVTKQLEKNQADRLKVAKERAQLLTSFQAVTAQFNEVVVKQNLMEGKGAEEAPKSTTTTTSNPPSGN